MAKNSQSLRHWKLPIPCQTSPKRFTLYKRHGEVRRSRDFARGEQRHDMRMLELGGQLNLPPEAVEAHALRHVALEDLHDDLSLQSTLFGHKNPAHSTAAKLPVEGVRLTQIFLEG